MFYGLVLHAISNPKPPAVNHVPPAEAAMPKFPCGFLTRGKYICPIAIRKTGRHIRAGTYESRVLRASSKRRFAINH